MLAAKTRCKDSTEVTLHCNGALARTREKATEEEDDQAQRPHQPEKQAKVARDLNGKLVELNQLGTSPTHAPLD